MESRLPQPFRATDQQVPTPQGHWIELNHGESHHVISWCFFWFFRWIIMFPPCFTHLNKSPFWEESFWNNQMVESFLDGFPVARSHPSNDPMRFFLGGGNGSDAAAQKNLTFILLGKNGKIHFHLWFWRSFDMVFKQAKTGINYSAL